MLADIKSLEKFSIVFRINVQMVLTNTVGQPGSNYKSSIDFVCKRLTIGKSCSKLKSVQ